MAIFEFFILSQEWTKSILNNPIRNSICDHQSNYIGETMDPGHNAIIKTTKLVPI